MSESKFTMPSGAPGFFTIYAPPPIVGYWVLDSNSPFSASIAMRGKPTDEQIKNTEALLGWAWRDAP